MTWGARAIIIIMAGLLMPIRRETPTELHVDVLPKQDLFLRSSAKELLYSGAWGSGKTRALCYKALIQASKPGAVVGLCRKTFASLQNTTLTTLLQPQGNLPPVIPQAWYKHNRQKHVISLFGGGQIIYFGVDDLTRVRSLGLSDVCIDEAIEIDEEHWEWLKGRCRLPGPFTRQISAATNPGHPGHFLYKRFYQEDKPGRQVIHTTSLENVFLPADVIAEYKKLEGIYYKRYVLGEWCAFEGLVYPAIGRCFVEPLDVVAEASYGGVDFGWNDPFCALAGSVYHDEQGRQMLYIWYERYKRETSIEQHAAALPQGVVWYADTESPENIVKLRAAGHKVRLATKHILPGVTAVNARIYSGRMLISKRCVAVRAEADAYRYPEKEGVYEGDKPVDKFNHAMDSLRYLVMGVDRRGMAKEAV